MTRDIDQRCCTTFGRIKGAPRPEVRIYGGPTLHTRIQNNNTLYTSNFFFHFHIILHSKSRMSKMLLLFTTSQFATTGSRSNLHRISVLHFSYLYIYSGILSKVSAKKNLNLCGPFLAMGLQRQHTQSPCK